MIQLGNENIDKIEDLEDINDREYQIVDENTKIIPKESMIMELSVLELPLFQFTYTKTDKLNVIDEPYTEEEIVNDSQLMFGANMSEQELKELNDLFGYEVIEKGDGTKIRRTRVERKSFSWYDSNNVKRGLLIKSLGHLPRQFEMDVFYGLLGLFVRKKGPFYKIDKQYDLKSSALYYTFYELSEYMGLTYSGTLCRQFRNAIRILKRTEYISLYNGVIYDKGEEKYTGNNVENSITLIQDYVFAYKTEKNRTTSEDMNMILFGRLILSNIANEYFKYINQNNYFSLPSGMVRKLYSYIEKCRYSPNKKELPYVKRKIEVLKVKLPLEYEYISRAKAKLINAIKELIKIGFIKDYIFTDEIEINKKKDKSKDASVIFCIKMTKEETIKDIESKENKKREDKKINAEQPYLKIPGDNLSKELSDRGIDANQIGKYINSMDKWDIIKYIIWADKKKYNNPNIESLGSQLAFMLKNHSDLKDGHSEIVEFVEMEKEKADKKTFDEKDHIKEEYKKYIDKSVEEFKEKDRELYDITYSLVLDGMEEKYKNYTSIPYLSEETKKNIEEFLELKAESNYFKELFEKEIKMLRNLMTFEEFSNKYISGKIIPKKNE